VAGQSQGTVQKQHTSLCIPTCSKFIGLEYLVFVFAIRAAWWRIDLSRMFRKIIMVSLLFDRYDAPMHVYRDISTPRFNSVMRLLFAKVVNVSKLTRFILRYIRRYYYYYYYYYYCYYRTHVVVQRYDSFTASVSPLFILCDVHAIELLVDISSWLTDRVTRPVKINRSIESS